LRSLLRILHSARQLSGAERAAAVAALGWLTAARVALHVLPYAAIRRACSRLPAHRHSARRLTAGQCRRAIEHAARLSPRAGCLPRAVAAECLLRRSGRPAALFLGAEITESHELRAHAWVDSGGITVAGGDEADRYRALVPRAQP
jgi:hypothetical protein